MNNSNVKKEQESFKRLLLLNVWAILFFIISLSPLAAQQALSIGGFYGRYHQYNQIESEYALDHFNVIENDMRFDAILWKNENWGLGIGIQRVNYRLGFEDNDPTYFRRVAHIRSRGTFIPLNFVYRYPLAKVFKSPLYVYGHAGLIFSFNSFAVRNWQPYWESTTRTWPDTLHYYNYYLDYSFNNIITKLDLGIGLNYQILKNFSFGIEARYNQGLQKVGELQAYYYPEGAAARAVTVRHYGSAWMLGGRMQFHFLLKKRSAKPIKLN